MRAYRKSQKNDYADAEAIAEAATRPSMREVAVKSVSQQELQLLHRQRASWVRTRTEHANRCRAILQEFGLTLPKGIASVRNRLPLLIEDAEVALPERMRALLYELWADIRGLDERLAGLDRELGERLNADPRGRRLLAIPGVGPVVGSGLWAALMEHNAWRCGRDFAVWLGLTPQQHSTGGRSRLGAITKRGDAYLRMQLIHGARSVVRQAHRGDDALRRWLQALIGRRPKAVAITALANKLARIAWAVVHHNSDFDARHAAA